MSITNKCSIRPFSSFLSARRRNLNLTLPDLARRAALPIETLELLESGEAVPSPSQAYCLGAALRVDPTELGEWAVTLLMQHPQFLLEHVQRATA